MLIENLLGAMRKMSTENNINLQRFFDQNNEFGDIMTMFGVSFTGNVDKVGKSFQRQF